MLRPSDLLRVTVPLELLLFFVGIPFIAFLIAWLAWSGKPQNFSRGMYWTSFIAAGAIAGFLIVLAQKMRPVETAEYLTQDAVGVLGLLLFGVSMGCGLGIFFYRRKSSSN